MFDVKDADDLAGWIEPPRFTRGADRVGRYPAVMLQVEPVPPEATRPLRQQVLRPHQTLDELAHPYEQLPETGAFAAMLDGRMVGTALVFPEARGGSPAGHQWRLVALAVDPAYRRRGVGTGLLAECVRHAARAGGNELWCHARTGAITFYLAAGFTPTGPEWLEENTGPHVLMWRTIGPVSRLDG